MEINEIFSMNKVNMRREALNKPEQYPNAWKLFSNKDNFVFTIKQLDSEHLTSLNRILRKIKREMSAYEMNEAEVKYEVGTFDFLARKLRETASRRFVR